MRKFRKVIHYLRKPNGGQASAFNFGFVNTRGEAIALLDADDVWAPDKLERVYEEFQRRSEVGMVYHRVHLWNGVSEISEDAYFIFYLGRVVVNGRVLLQYPMVGTSWVAFRRGALQKSLPVLEPLRFQAGAYLTALIIFVAEVTAVPEFLGEISPERDKPVPDKRRTNAVQPDRTLGESSRERRIQRSSWAMIICIYLMTCE